MKIEYLRKLADVIVNVDEGKGIDDSNIVSLTDRGLRLVDEMKLLSMDVGTLQEILVGMQLMCSNRALMPELIEMAHEEIARLLGSDEWRLYGREDKVAA